MEEFNPQKFQEALEKGTLNSFQKRPESLTHEEIMKNIEQRKKEESAKFDPKNIEQGDMFN